MTSQEQAIKTLIPDLRDIPVDQLADMANAQNSPLARSIALHQERIKENGVPLSSFQAWI